MKKIDSIPAAALILALSALFSRVLGYAREMLLAYYFGASATTDAFYAAFQIPDLLNYFLSGGALSIAFIPLYNKVRARDGDEAATKLFNTVLGTLGAAVVLLTGVLYYYAAEITAFQFPGFDEQTSAMTVMLTRMVLPAQIFFITGGILQAVLLANRHFKAAALAPLVYNICIIAGGFLLAPIMGIRGFAVGTIAGAILGPFLLPLIQSRRLIKIAPRAMPMDKGFLVYLVLALPLMFGQTLLTLDEWYGRWFGATLGTGAVAHLGYARRLMQVPIAVIGQAVAAAALPLLSLLWAEGREKEVNATLQRTLRVSIMFSILCGGVFLLMAQPLVTLVYQHGAFLPKDTVDVSLLTALYTLAIPAWIIQQVSVRGFYARGDTWRPMILGTVLSLSVLPLYFYGAKHAGTTGIALAGVAGMCINAIGTLLLARIYHHAPSLRAMGGSVLRGVAMTAPAYVAADYAVRYLGLPPVTDKISALYHGTVGGGIYAVIGLAGLVLIGGGETKEFLQKLRQRIKR